MFGEFSRYMPMPLPLPVIFLNIFEDNVAGETSAKTLSLKCKIRDNDESLN